MHNDFPNSAPNYTSACVVMFAVNVTWVLIAVWLILGFVYAIVLAWAISHAITYLSERADRRAAQDRAHPRSKIRPSPLP
ncbi:MAG: hypothetical protein AB8B71_09735 [Paracoccaceae bacterium]